MNAVKKRVAASLLAALMCLAFLSGCGDSYAPETEDTSAYSSESAEETPDFSGNWVNAKGDILRVDFENRTYYIQKNMEQGIRLGSGNTGPFGEESLVYNGFKYAVSVKGDVMQLENLGSESGYENTGGPDDILEGPFNRDNSVEMLPYNLKGHWSNGAGVHLWMEESNYYTYQNENDSTMSVGNLNGDRNGMGLSITVDMLEIYFFLSPDGNSLISNPADAFGEGNGVFAFVGDE